MTKFCILAALWPHLPYPAVVDHRVIPTNHAAGDDCRFIKISLIGEGGQH